VDLVAVFNGDKGRVEKGFTLANDQVAPFLVISPASTNYLERLDQELRRDRQFQYLPENQADTTFQNALFVSRIIRRYHFHSVVLVTDNYHMPRAYILLRLQLAGTDTKIFACPVETRPLATNPFMWSTLQKKRIYNEMAEFWGSALEMLKYRFSGEVSENGLKKNPVLSFFRGLLLFKIESERARGR